MQLYEYTAHELRSLLRSGEVSAAETARALLERIAGTDPQLNAYITVLGDAALEQAGEADRMLKAGDGGALCGVPVGIKDNICIRGVRTTCASRMLENFFPPYDANAIELLRAQGSVFLGKCNMDEFAMGSSTETSYFGTVRNPHDLSRVPGGSSGGSAAAVAAGSAVVAIGSDTGGSIRQPASLCGVVGMKPTYGMVSRYGLIAFASSLDQIGPLARSVRDCAMVLDAIVKGDSRDTTSIMDAQDGFEARLNIDMKGKARRPAQGVLRSGRGRRGARRGAGSRENLQDRWGQLRGMLATAGRVRAGGLLPEHPRPRRVPTWRVTTASLRLPRTRRRPRGDVRQEPQRRVRAGK